MRFLSFFIIGAFLLVVFLSMVCYAYSEIHNTVKPKEPETQREPKEKASDLEQSFNKRGISLRELLPNFYRLKELQNFDPGFKKSIQVYITKIERRLNDISVTFHSLEHEDLVNDAHFRDTMRLIDSNAKDFLQGVKDADKMQLRAVTKAVSTVIQQNRNLGSLNV